MRRTARTILLAASIVLSALGAAQASAQVLVASRESVSFGELALGVRSATQPVFLTNRSSGDARLTGISVSGDAAADFVLGGTCATGRVLRFNESCRIDAYAVASSRTAREAAIMATVDRNIATTVALRATVVASDDDYQPPIVGEAWFDFDLRNVRPGFPVVDFTIANPGTKPFSISSVAADQSLVYVLQGTDCVGVPIAAGHHCSARISPTTAAFGIGRGVLTITVEGHGDYTIAISDIGGDAGPPATADVAEAVEYFNQTLDHYFMTAAPDEIAALDSGRTRGWSRTGFSFQTFVASASAAGTVPVCRFYIPPTQGDSHFYSADAAECARVAAQFPTFVAESAAVLRVFPVVGSGAAAGCTVGTRPVYRLWNRRVDSNHRYTTDWDVRSNMIARGYVPEGAGVDGIVMCVAPAF